MINKKRYEKMVADSTPGRFEGENPETAYFYEAMLDGDGELFKFKDSETFTVFKLSDEEKEIFEIAHDYFAIYISDSGFIHGYKLTSVKYNKMIKELEAEWED